MARLWFRVALAVITLAGSPAGAASVAGRIADANAQAARCDYPGAIATMRGALAEADRRWPAGHEGFFILHHSLAGWLNERFDYGAAEQEARAALAIARDKRGEADPLYALAAQNLGVALIGRRRFAEAERQLATATDILVARGDTPNALNALLASSGLAAAEGRSAQALVQTERAAVLLPAVARIQPAVVRPAALRVAEARRRMLRFAEAAAALAQAEAAPPVPGAGAKRLLLARASLAFDTGDLSGALSLLDSAEAAAADPCDPVVVSDLAARRGTIQLIARAVSEARLSFTLARSRLEALGLEHGPRYAEALAGLAMTTSLAGEFDLAGRLFDRAIATMREAFGSPTSAEAQVALEQAYTLSAAGRPAEAIPIAERTRAILAGSIDQQPLDRAYAAAVLGLALKEGGRLAEAEPLLLEALAAFEAQRGSGSFDLVPGLIALGDLRLAQGRTEEAEQFLNRALAIQRQGGWSGAQTLGVTYSRLAAVHLGQGNTTVALRDSGQAVAVLEERVMLGEQKPWADAEAERRRARGIVEQDLALAFAAMPDGDAGQRARKAERLLRGGQLNASIRTGEAIAQMAVRLSHRGDRTGRLVRERQDLVARFRAVQQDELAELIRAREGGADTAGAPGGLEAIASRLREVDRAIGQGDRKAGLVLRSPVASLAQVQPLLTDDEVMLAFFVTADATTVVAISSGDCVSYRSRLTRADLLAAVTTLRGALEPANWPQGIPPPFPAALAHRLWRELIAPAGALLTGGKRILAVPDGPLMSLPLGVLLTAPMAETDQDYLTYKQARWLIRERAVVVFPSVAAFATLRSMPKVPVASTRFLGIGSPTVTGPLAQRLHPLPDAATELEAMAGQFGRGHAVLRLGPDARERWVRAEPLRRFATIAFATHGLIAGDLSGHDEPALVLASPPAASVGEDGLLGASEVAGLKLDADWVILAACSTAASDGRPEAEPFTGLVKAFFYAGARALFATNWRVDSQAAATLTGRMMKGVWAGMDRGRALQAAQLAMIDDRDESGRTHPAFWASYNLIGSR